MHMSYAHSICTWYSARIICAYFFTHYIHALYANIIYTQYMHMMKCTYYMYTLYAHIISTRYMHTIWCTFYVHPLYADVICTHHVHMLHGHIICTHPTSISYTHVICTLIDVWQRCQHWGKIEKKLVCWLSATLVVIVFRLIASSQAIKAETLINLVKT